MVQAIADEYGWEVSVRMRQSTARVGTVVSMGTKVGTLMHLHKKFVVLEAMPLDLPNFVGLTLKQARAIASKCNWHIDVTAELFSSQPKGTLVGQTQHPGEQMPEGVT